MQWPTSNLYEHPALRAEVARSIWEAFWSHGQGFTAGELEHLLSHADRPDRLPLCRIVTVRGALLGTASLIDNDDPARPQLWSWLAAVWVAPPVRGRGVGSCLVESIRQDAARLGIRAIHLGTDQPAWYARFGATFLEQARPDLVILRLPTVDDGTVAPAGA